MNACRLGRADQSVYLALQPVELRIEIFNLPLELLESPPRRMALRPCGALRVQSQPAILCSILSLHVRRRVSPIARLVAEPRSNLLQELLDAAHLPQGNPIDLVHVENSGGVRLAQLEAILHEEMV